MVEKNVTKTYMRHYVYPRHYAYMNIYTYIYRAYDMHVTHMNILVHNVYSILICMRFWCRYDSLLLLLLQQQQALKRCVSSRRGGGCRVREAHNPCVVAIYINWLLFLFLRTEVGVLIITGTFNIYI